MFFYGLFSSDESLFDSDRAVEETSLLLQFVLDCLHKIFLYDTQRFLSRERADALLSPLVDQVRARLSVTLLTVVVVGLQVLQVFLSSKGTCTAL